MGQQEFALDILNRFVDSLDEELAKLDQMNSPFQQSLVVAFGHRLKGSAATVSANDICKAFYELEQVAKSGRTEALADQVQLLHAEKRRLKEFVATL